MGIKTKSNSNHGFRIEYHAGTDWYYELHNGFTNIATIYNPKIAEALATALNISIDY